MKNNIQVLLKAALDQKKIEKIILIKKLLKFIKQIDFDIQQ